MSAPGADAIQWHTDIPTTLEHLATGQLFALLHHGNWMAVRLRLRFNRQYGALLVAEEQTECELLLDVAGVQGLAGPEFVEAMASAAQQRSRLVVPQPRVRS